MINAKLNIDTKHIPLNGINYCAYCGKPIQVDKETDGYYQFSYYHCDCEDALKEIEIQSEINKLEEDIRKLRYRIPFSKFTCKNNNIVKSL